MLKWFRKKLEVHKKKTIELDIESYINDPEFIKSLKSEEVPQFCQYFTMYNKSIGDAKHYKKLLLGIVLKHTNRRQ